MINHDFRKTILNETRVKIDFSVKKLKVKKEMKTPITI